MHECLDQDVRKITHTVKNGASNFRKAFVEYKQVGPDTVESDNPEFVNVGSILDGTTDVPDSDDPPVVLPKQQRCCSHKSDCSTDADDAKANPEYSQMYNITMGKCQAI